MKFRYPSGEEILPGDRIAYAGSLGEVEFVITGATGDPSINWCLTLHPGGCFMIKTEATGRVLLGATDEDLAFVSRQTG